MNYIYSEECSSHAPLKCKLCTKPLVDPVGISNGDRFCRLCAIEHNITDFITIEEPLVLLLLNNLLVTCPDCQKTDLRRIDLVEHLRNECPKRLVFCKASDLKCPWNGSCNEYDNHVSHCTFELLRPILSETIGCKKQIDDCQTEINEQKNEINQLKEKLAQYQDRLDKIHKGLKVFFDLNLQQKNRYDKFQNDLQQLQGQTQISSLSNDFQQIKEQFEQFQSELKNFGEFELNTNKQIKQLQNHDQQQVNQILHIRQETDQHQVQIRLLLRRKCVIPKTTAYTDPKLQELIEPFKFNSEINLNSQHFNNQDMEFLCKATINDKQCEKLHLENNDISPKSIAILADTLYGNITLKELYLSNNSISDMGVHSLAQVLAINNSTLECLHLHSNDITDEGAEYLGEMLKTNKRLSSLGLKDNQITDRGVKLLTSAITCYNEAIECLQLNSNKLITDASLDNIIAMMKYNRSLKKLSLKDCDLSKKAVNDLKKQAESNKNFVLEI